jgi:hypothetical protein
MQESRANSSITLVPERKPDQLLRSRFVPPSTIELTFADRSFPLDIALLGIPMDRIRWETARAVPTGDAMIVDAIKGEQIPFDSATLRYLVDPVYAAEADLSAKSLQFTREELAEMAKHSKPPQWFYDEPEEDVRLESWK